MSKSRTRAIWARESIRKNRSELTPVKLNGRHLYTINVARAGESLLQSFINPNDSGSEMRPLRSASGCIRRTPPSWSLVSFLRRARGTSRVRHRPSTRVQFRGARSRETADLRRCQDRIVCSRWKHRAKNRCSLPNPRPYLIKKSATMRGGRSTTNTKIKI